MECLIDRWDTVCWCFSRRLNGNKLNHLADGTFASLKQLQRLYAIQFNSRTKQKKDFIFVFFILIGILVLIDYELLKKERYKVSKKSIICKCISIILSTNNINCIDNWITMRSVVLKQKLLMDSIDWRLCE
jgi:uncharacterized membrane protein